MSSFNPISFPIQTVIKPPVQSTQACKGVLSFMSRTRPFVILQRPRTFLPLAHDFNIDLISTGYCQKSFDICICCLRNIYVMPLLYKTAHIDTQAHTPMCVRVCSHSLMETHLETQVYVHLLNIQIFIECCNIYILRNFLNTFIVSDVPLSDAIARGDP